MADGTALVAAITGFSTLSAGIGGAYLTARQQSETARRGVEAEREKAETERQQTALDRRLSTYREFLDVERQLRMLVASGRDFTSDEFFDWLSSFNRTYNLLVLTGTREARRRADGLFTELQAMEHERIDDQSEAIFADKLRNAYLGHDKRLRDIRDDLIETMRQDVAPGDAG
jgi:hypothetical protein